MSDELTLLPCPFCSGEAYTVNDDERYWTVECHDCAAHTGLYATKDFAIAAWNTRAPVEHDGWFYLPKPKESIVQYGEQRAEKTEHGYKVTQPVEVIEGAIRSWGDELGEYIMKRICEAWNTRTHDTLTAERVRETVEKHWYDLSAEYDMPEATALPEYSYDWQAIADELNAKLRKAVER